MEAGTLAVGGEPSRPQTGPGGRPPSLLPRPVAPTGPSARDDTDAVVGAVGADTPVRTGPGLTGVPMAGAAKAAPTKGVGRALNTAGATMGRAVAVPLLPEVEGEGPARVPTLRLVVAAVVGRPASAVPATPSLGLAAALRGTAPGGGAVRDVAEVGAAPLAAPAKGEAIGPETAPKADVATTATASAVAHTLEVASTAVALVGAEEPRRAEAVPTVLVAEVTPVPQGVPGRVVPGRALVAPGSPEDGGDGLHAAALVAIRPDVGRAGATAVRRHVLPIGGGVTANGVAVHAGAVAPPPLVPVDGVVRPFLVRGEGRPPLAGVSVAFPARLGAPSWTRAAVATTVGLDLPGRDGVGPVAAEVEGTAHAHVVASRVPVPLALGRLIAPLDVVY